ncbi:MAG: cytochrome c [Holophagales bacterium]|nr:cytochrome c [Holophagales bacterium]
MRPALLWILPPLLLSAPLSAQAPASATAPATPSSVPAATTATAAAPAAPPQAQEQSPAEDLFARKCGSCHTVGKGVRVGPDLKDVAKRRSRAWLELFVKTPSALLDSDPDARNLLAEFKGVRMPDLGLSDAESRMLVDLVIRCSTEPCNLAGRFVAATTATPRDRAVGRELFLGLAPMKAGGAPCVSCHTVRGSKGLLGGGRLAKDLTNVFARLGDEGLDTALKSPAFPLMNKVYAVHPLEASEAFALRAFLYEANLGGEPARDDSWSVSLAGGLGSLGALVGLNAAWGRRLRGVRQPLTRRRENGKEHLS